MSTPPSPFCYLSRSAKLKNAQKMYTCECGKAYLTYSSLYLHFKKQHNQKISTKAQTKNRLIRNYQGRTIQTYFYSGEVDQNDCPHLQFEQSYSENKVRKENENSPNFKLHQLKKLLHEFLEDFQDETESKRVLLQAQDTMTSLFSFISEKRKEKNNIYFTASNLNLMQLPYFFNPFILQTAEKEKCNLSQKKMKKKCEKLKALAIWMKKKNYTELEVECELIDKDQK